MAATVSSKVTDETNGFHAMERISKLPLVEVALMKSAGLYERFKASSDFANWTLTTAETAAKKALDTAQPVLDKLQQPITAVDHTVCKGLDYVEAKFPYVKEQPSQMYEDAKVYSLDKMAAAKTFGSDKAHSLADLSWQKANDVLATRYGDMAFNGINTSATIAEQYLDYYFPPTEEEAKEIDPPTTDEVLDDRVLKTVHTVGHLSTKLARRVYSTVARQALNLNAENAHQYVRSLVALLTLNNYVNALQAGEGKTPAEGEGKVAVKK